jgi:hypothetical protein
MEKLKELREKIKNSKQRVFTRAELYEMIDILEGYEKPEESNCNHEEYNTFASGYKQCVKCKWIWK